MRTSTKSANVMCTGPLALANLQSLFLVMLLRSERHDTPDS